MLRMQREKIYSRQNDTRNYFIVDHRYSYRYNITFYNIHLFRWVAPGLFYSNRM